MKFIHTADLHLDSPFIGLQHTPAKIKKDIMQSTFAAFKKIVSNAISTHIDFIVIAGDIYDRDSHSVQAENFFIQQCELLQKNSIDVYLSYGNHDYQIVNYDKSLLPNNVHVFGNQVETKTFTTTDGTKVAITGFSYETRWVTDDMTGQYPSRSQVDVQIGMLHGMVSGSNAKHDNYAPFSVAELTDKNYDYWALGHIHAHQVLSENPWVIYSGNPQGRHKNETGSKGYYEVDYQNHQLQPVFKTVAPIDWEKLVIEINQDMTAQTLQTVLVQSLKEHANDTNQIIQIELHGDTVTPDIPDNIESGLLLESLQRVTSEWQPNWVWPIEIKVTENAVLPGMTSLDRQYWETAAGEVFNQDTLHELTNKLFANQFIADEFDNQTAIESLKEQIELDLSMKGEK